MSQTVDLGIDFGTTNSAIAVVENGRAQVLKDDFDGVETLPSCVAFSRDGSTLVGSAARNILQLNPSNAFEGFKRQLGTQRTWTAPALGRTVSPEELASIILKELRRRAQLWLNEEPRATVITIPAVFGEVEKHALTSAARMAGFDNVTLVQEPVAAGLAYGWDRADDPRPFLVYDIGGGTFDVSLLQCIGGQLSVIGHLGEHTLGGRDMDDLIAESLIPLGVTSQIAQDDENEKALRLCCEDAKKRLSSLTDTQLAFSGAVRSRDGQRMENVVPISRRNFEALILPKVDQSIAIVKRLLADRQVDPADLAGILLVGGPTRIPLIRERLSEVFNAPVLTRIDPMTVVAQGAALFAASILRESSNAPATSNAQAHRVRFAYEPVTGLSTTPVGLAIEDANLLDGSIARFRRSDGLWESGLMRLNNGQVMVQVSLADAPVSSFNVEVFDRSGTQIAIDPSSFQITRGLAAAAPPLSRHIGVLEETRQFFGSADSLRISIIAERGQPTPITNRVKFVTTKQLTPGSPEPVLTIGIFEGPAHEQKTTRPGRFRMIGRILITGTDVDRPLPAGTEVEITIRVDTAGEAIARAFFPSLERTFQDILEFEHGALPTVEEAEQRLVEVEQRLTPLNDLAIDTDSLQTQIDTTRREVRSAQNWSADRQARALSALETIEIEADIVEDNEAPRIALAELATWLENAEEVVSNFGDAQQRRQLDQLRSSAERARLRTDPTELNAIEERLRDLALSLYWNQPGPWVQKFQELAQSTDFTNPSEAAGLLARGRQALELGDIEMLKRVVIDLVELKPRATAASPWDIYRGITRVQ